MVSHTNYNLDANEDFVIFLTSKLIIMCSIDGSLREWNPNQLLVYEGEVIEGERWSALNVEICGQAAFKNTNLKLDRWKFVFSQD
jgi:hypothetical protein